MPYPSNSKNRKVSAVTQARVGHEKKRSLATDLQSLGRALTGDILVPALKGALSDFFQQGVEALIFGPSEDRGARRSYRSYNTPYRGRRASGSLRQPRRPFGGHYDESPRIVTSRQASPVFDDLYFESREDATQVIRGLMELVYKYGVTTVGDYYTLAGLTATRTAEQYGWSALDRVRVLSTADGYVIDLPDPEALGD